MDIFLAIVSFLLGWSVSHFYYLKALNSSNAEAVEGRRIEQLILKGIENVGNIQYSRDASGKIVGVVIEAKTAEAVGANDAIDAAVIHPINAK